MKNLLRYLHYDMFCKLENSSKKLKVLAAIIIIPIILLKLFVWFTPIPRFIGNFGSIAWIIFILAIPLIVNNG